MKRFKFIILLYFVCFFKVNAQQNYPILKQIVTDDAHLFSGKEVFQLSEKLTAYEERTTHQIVVLTINDLGNDTVENYAFQTFNLKKNKLGQGDDDNGILILIAKNNRKFRIEVGDGFEPIITDAISSRIVRNIITPAFKKGAFFEGVNDATTEIIKIIDNPVYAQEFINSSEHSEDSVSIITKFFSSIFLTTIFFLLGFYGYKKLLNKKKRHNITLKKLYQNNKRNVLLIFVLAICMVTYFNAFFWMVFFGLFVVAFFSVFILVGLLVILKGAYQRATSIFESLFTGKLGIIVFPFYVPITLLLLFAGILFTVVPIIMGLFFAVSFYNQDFFEKKLSATDPLFVFFIVIAVVILFFVISALIAVSNILKSQKKSFGFSFFKFDKSLQSSGSGGSFSGSSRSYGSSGYSSSSSSSFSGGGGSSSGGGASGSW